MASVLMSHKNGLDTRVSKYTYLPIGDLPAGTALEHLSIGLGEGDNLFSTANADDVQFDDVRITLAFFGQDVFKKDILIARERGYHFSQTTLAIASHIGASPVALIDGLDGLAINHVADLKRARTQTIHMRFNEMAEKEARQTSAP